MIRKPNDNEANDCIRLIYMSGKEMLSYFLIEKDPEIYKYINVFYTKPDLLFSRENVLVKKENEKVCGLLLTVPAKDMLQLDKNTAKYGKELFEVTGLKNAVKMMFRSGLSKYMSNIYNSDEYYISNLAVFEEFRGRGYGVELLKKAEELAREKGYNKLSLTVEFYNENAKKLYEKFGFIETDKVDFPKKFHK